MSKEIEERSTGSSGIENLAIFDIDGTLTRGFALFGLIRAQIAAGKIAGDTGVSATMIRMENGSGTEYETNLSTLLAQYAEALKGASEEQIQEHADEYYSQQDLWLPFAKPTIDELRSRNFGIAVVSGGPQFAVKAAAKFLGVHEDLSYSSWYSTIKTDGDTDNMRAFFTGEVDHDLATSTKKGEVVSGLRKELYRQNPRGITLYCGDSDGDAIALHMVNGAFVVRPSKTLEKRSRQFGWNQIPEDQLNSPKFPQTVENELKSLANRRLLVVKPPNISSK